MRNHDHAFARAASLSLILICLAQTARAQDIFLQPPPDGTARSHMAPTGKPCVKVTKSVKAETIHPNIFQHWISATNSCGQAIKMKVCYYRTRDCIDVNVPAWGKQEAILGIFPALRSFRYSYTEQF